MPFKKIDDYIRILLQRLAPSWDSKVKQKKEWGLTSEGILVRTIRGWELRPRKYDRGTQTRRAKVESAFIPLICVWRGVLGIEPTLFHMLSKSSTSGWYTQPYSMFWMFLFVSVLSELLSIVFFLRWGCKWGRNKIKRWQCFRPKIKPWELALPSSSRCV